MKNKEGNIKDNNNIQKKLKDFLTKTNNNSK